MKYNLDSFTDVGKITNIKKEIEKLEQEINKCNNWDYLDDIHRVLAYLMRRIRDKEYRLFKGKFKTSNRYLKIAKEMGFFQKTDGIPYAYHLQKGLGSFLDHCYKEKINDTEIFVSEPYNLSLEEMKEIIRFCKENKLNCWINGKSKHFPDSTIKINFVKFK